MAILYYFLNYFILKPFFLAVIVFKSCTGLYSELHTECWLLSSHFGQIIPLKLKDTLQPQASKSINKSELWEEQTGGM